LQSRELLGLLEYAMSQGNGDSSLANKMAKEIAAGAFDFTQQMLQTVGSTVSGVIDLMLKAAFAPFLDVDPIDQTKKEKRKKAGTKSGNRQVNK
jgi:hypothetical protein